MNTLRRRLTGLLAVLLLGVLVVGLPVLLVAAGANPLAVDWSTLDQLWSVLTRPDDGTMALTLLMVVAWISWAVLTVSILMEIVSRLRGVRAPRLPGLKVPQNAARGLVGAAALLFVSVPVANAAPAMADAPAAVVQTSHAPATQLDQQVAHEAPASTEAQATGQTETPDQAAVKDATERESKTVEHTVRSGESLWSIAQQYLGDGRAYVQIVEANKKLLGSGADFLEPGWELSIPVPDDQAKDDKGAKDKGDKGQRTVTVERGDTLSGIAKDELGEAERYDEILEASRGIEQPGGARLSDPNVIDVGWTVAIPDQDTAEQTPAAKTSDDSDDADRAQHTSQAPAEDTETAADDGEDVAEPGAADQTPAQDATSAETQNTDEPNLAAPEAPAPADVAPDHAATDAPAPAQDTVDQDTVDQVAETNADDTDETPAWVARTSYGVGALMAAGVLSLVVARRRQQQRTRKPGQQLPTPDTETAQAELELRATADQLSVETIDAALRDLATSCAHNGTPLPTVRAARLIATEFDLYLAEPAQLPAPWAGTDDQLVWRLDVDHTTTTQHTDRTDTPAPYPALVVIGHDDEDGHVLLNLEHLGSLDITGDDTPTRETLAALAIELASSLWADDLQVTLIGAFAELEDALQTGHIRYLPTIGHIIDDLTTRATTDREALAAEGAADLNAARVTGSAPDAWAPEIVMLAGDIPQRQRDQLAELVESMPRVAIATVTSGNPATAWRVDLTAGDTPEHAVLEPIGLQLRPQKLPATEYGHLLTVAALTDVEEISGTALPEPSLAEVEAITPINDVDDVDEHDQHDEHADEQHRHDVDEHDHEEADEHDDEAADAVEQEVRTPDVVDAGQRAEAQVADGPEHVAPAPDITPAATADVSTIIVDGDAADLDMGITEAEDATSAAPTILLLGPVEMINPAGKVEQSKRARLLELGAYLALNPGATHTAIDAAIWPDRRSEDNLNTRNTATSKLRRWVGKAPDGSEYLPRRHQADNGYRFAPAVTTDVDTWDTLLSGAPATAPTDSLEAALKLVRGMPFEGVHRRRYAWAEPLQQRLISEIVDASYELGRRRLLEGRWRAAEHALVVGLRVEPAQETLWRLRILAAHESRNTDAEAQAIDRLLTITDQLECGLEPATQQLLAALQDPGSDFDRLMAGALL